MRNASPLTRLAGRHAFLEAQLGPHWSAPFGGFSWKALEAYACLVEAWYAGDSGNRGRCVDALTRLVPAFHPNDHAVLKAIIHGLGYEGAIAQLWPLICPAQVKQ